MRRASHRGWARLATVILLIVMTGAVMAGCSGDSPSSPDPAPGAADRSPTPSPNPAPSPSPAPSGLTVASISVTPSSVQGQQQPTAVVTLTSSAPSSGVLVQLASSNPTVAQVPSSVMIVGGQTSTSFAVSTSTVPNDASSTISATFNGTTRTAAVTVRAPGLVAGFTVRSPTKGTDSCLFGPDTDEADCTLDGSGSSGFVHQYHWTYWTGGAPIGHVTEQPQSALQLDSNCRFFENGRGGEDSSGKWVQMTVEMFVTDRVGTRSAPVRRAVRLYPNRLCGFNY